jgi:hypothetical protein
MTRIGWVTQLSPLRVQLNGDTTDAAAEATSDFTGATADASPAVATLVLVETVEGRRFAERISPPAGVLASTYAAFIALIDTGAWTAYTPVIGGTGWGVGNGTFAAAYQKVGKAVHYRMVYTFGSTVTAGTGGLTFSLPLAAVATLDNTRAVGQFVKASNGARYPLQGSAVSTTADAVLHAISPMAAVTSTIPIAPLVGDKITLAGSYQAA